MFRWSSSMLVIASGVVAAQHVNKVSTTMGASDCKEPSCKSKADTFKLLALQQSNDPPSREELGRAGWTILHAVAANYPEKPSKEDKEAAVSFLTGFAYLYPCKDCARGFQQNILETPPTVGSREEFSQWMCHMHNKVNEELGKKSFSCSPKNLRKRWYE